LHPAISRIVRIKIIILFIELDDWFMINIY